MSKNPLTKAKELLDRFKKKPPTSDARLDELKRKADKLKNRNKFDLVVQCSNNPARATLIKAELKGDVLHLQSSSAIDLTDEAESKASDLASLSYNQIERDESNLDKCQICGNLQKCACNCGVNSCYHSSQSKHVCPGCKRRFNTAHFTPATSISGGKSSSLGGGRKALPRSPAKPSLPGTSAPRIGKR